MYILDVVYILLSEIQKGPLGCPDKLIALSKNVEDEVTFGFSICAMSLQVTLVVYFRSETEDLGGKRLLEDNKVCYC